MSRKDKLKKCDYQINENCETWSKRCTKHKVVDGIDGKTFKYKLACPNCENCFDDE